ncbi:quinone oxidoreductase [Absidia repens]|uniref:Probable quinone oxidoreductase n=1 Tax=Absidia repens TaxID=90262 RepID=A0A1X2IKS9_9FUNG|nr:quinone oxidoreductase [Absidia repens]
MSTTMKAIVVEEYGATDKLLYKDVPKPTAEKDTVVIKNHCIGVNFIDNYHRTGLYPLPLPFIVGRDSAGEVVEVGEGVTDFKVGDRVVQMSGSSYAEYSQAKAASVEKISHDISYDLATAAALQGLTALTLVRDSYPVKKNDYILVHAAAGGVGLLLCQLGKHIGAHVIGTASTDEKCALAKENGAEFTINSSNEDITKRVNEITGGVGVHASLDGVGKATFDISLAATRRLGSVISFGNASGAVPPISIGVLAQKNLKLMRPTLYNYLATREESRRWFDELFSLMKDGVLNFHIHKVYDLKDAKQAQDDIQARVTTGKLLLRP